MKSKIRSTSYFLKYFISNDLENMKDSLIITVIEEGIPKNIYDHNYKRPLSQLFKRGQRARSKPTSLIHCKQITSKGDFNNSF